MDLTVPPDGYSLLLLHGHVLLEVPGFDHFDGSKNHILTHTQVLFLPQSDDSVIMAFQFLGSFDGFMVRRG